MAIDAKSDVDVDADPIDEVPPYVTKVLDCDMGQRITALMEETGFSEAMVWSAVQKACKGEKMAKYNMITMAKHNGVKYNNLRKKTDAIADNVVQTCDWLKGMYDVGRCFMYNHILTFVFGFTGLPQTNPLTQDVIACFADLKEPNRIHETATGLVGGPLMIHIIGALFEKFESVCYGTITSNGDQVIMIAPNEITPMELTDTVNQAAHQFESSVVGFNITEDCHVMAIRGCNEAQHILKFTNQTIITTLNGEEMTYNTNVPQDDYMEEIEEPMHTEEPEDTLGQLSPLSENEILDDEDLDAAFGPSDEDEPTPTEEPMDEIPSDILVNEAAAALDDEEAFEPMDDQPTWVDALMAQAPDEEDDSQIPPWSIEVDHSSEIQIILPHMLPEDDYKTLKDEHLRDKLIEARHLFSAHQKWIGGNKEPWIMKKSPEYKCALFDLTAALLQVYTTYAIGSLVCYII